MKSEPDAPKVSIVTITYNHQKFIREALESFIEQEVNFNVEVLVADDASSDETPSIIGRYANDYPEIIRPILRKSNIGILENLVGAMQEARGEYIALCEGDDYWIDPLKLKKQVEFMDANNEYTVCFHRVKVITEGEASDDTTYPNPEFHFDFTLRELLEQNFIQTNAVMYRRQDYSKIPKGIMPVDWYLHLLHAKKGKIGFIDEVMSAYRRHPGGVWWNSGRDNDAFWRKNGLGHFTLIAEIYRLYGDVEDFGLIISKWFALILSRLNDIDSRYGTKLFDEAINLYPREDTLYIKSLARAMVEHENKYKLTNNHVEDLKNQILGHENYIKKLESDIGSLTAELKSVYDSRAYKLLKKLK